jgi:hypothetical protein
VGGKALGPEEEPDDAEVEAELAKRYVGEVPYRDVVPQPDQEVMSPAEKDDLLQSVSGDDDLRQEWEREVDASETVSGGNGLQ